MTTATDHATKVMTEINTSLMDLSLTYDTKLLAAMLLTHAAAHLRNLHAAGILKSADVEAMIVQSFAGVLEPLPAEKQPKVITIGGSAGQKVN